LAILGNVELVYIAKGIIDGIILLVEKITSAVLEAAMTSLSNEVHEFITKHGGGDTELYYGLGFVIISFIEEIIRIFKKNLVNLQNAQNKYFIT